MAAEFFEAANVEADATRARSRARIAVGEETHLKWPFGRVVCDLMGMQDSRTGPTFPLLPVERDRIPQTIPRVNGLADRT